MNMVAKALSVCVLLCAQPSQASTLPPALAELQHQLERVVYCIVSRWTHEGKTTVYHGTGVQFAPGLVATVAHQVDGMDDIALYRGDFRFSQADIIAIDRVHDLAVLRVAKRPGGLALNTVEDMPVGTEIFKVGCPFGLFHVTAQGRIQTPRTRIDGRSLMAMDMLIYTGDSGGPVLDLQGRWLGVIRGYLTGTPNISIAMPIEQLQALIQEAGIQGLE